MKAIIENIQYFSLHDGPGTRTTLFFKGCPLSCLWCSNPSTQEFMPELMFYEDKCFSCGLCVAKCPHNALSLSEKNRPVINPKACKHCGLCTDNCKGRALVLCGQEYDMDEAFKKIKKDIVFYHNSGGGVTFSGGEMLMHHTFILTLIEKCKAINIHTCAETSGFAKYEIVRDVISNLDMVYFDLKHINNEEHKKITGQENILIIDNLKRLLAEVSTPIHLRLPLIPTLNDSDEHLIEYAKFVSTLGGIRDLELLPYHRLGSQKYALLGRKYELEHIVPTPREKLMEQVSLVRQHAPNVRILCQG